MAGRGWHESGNACVVMARIRRYVAAFYDSRRHRYRGDGGVGIALHQYLHSRHQQCHGYICPLGIEKKPETATDYVVGDYRRTRNLVSDTSGG